MADTQDQFASIMTPDPGSEHKLRVYGRNVSSPWRFPLTYPSEFQEPDLVLSVDPHLSETADADQAWVRHETLPDGSDHIDFQNLFAFTVSPDGTAIRCLLRRAATMTSLQAYLFGQVMSFALLKMGAEPIHATVLELEGVGVALMGQPGMGKSTLAAGLLREGCRLLTDDLMVLQGPRLMVQPGVSRLKLFPEAATRLLPVKGEPMNPITPKLVLPLAGPLFASLPVPLRHIYVLRAGTGDRVTIRTLSRRSGFLELTRNTFNTSIDVPQRLEQQFRAAADVAAKVSVKSLTYLRDFEMLPTVVERILRDIS